MRLSGLNVGARQSGTAVDEHLSRPEKVGHLSARASELPGTLRPKTTASYFLHVAEQIAVLRDSGDAYGAWVTRVDMRLDSTILDWQVNPRDWGLRLQHAQTATARIFNHQSGRTIVQSLTANVAGELGSLGAPELTVDVDLNVVLNFAVFREGDSGGFFRADLPPNRGGLQPEACGTARVVRSQAGCRSAGAERPVGRRKPVRRPSGQVDDAAPHCELRHVLWSARQTGHRHMAHLRDGREPNAMNPRCSYRHHARAGLIVLNLPRTLGNAAGCRPAAAGGGRRSAHLRPDTTMTALIVRLIGNQLMFRYPIKDIGLPSGTRSRRSLAGPLYTLSTVSG